MPVGAKPWRWSRRCQFLPLHIRIAPGNCHLMCMGPDPKVLQVGGTTTAVLYFTNGEYLSATPSAWSTTVRAIERPYRRNVSTLVPIMALAAPLVACGQAPPWYDFNGTSRNGGTLSGGSTGGNLGEPPRILREWPRECDHADHRRQAYSWGA
jgi:hypothetical protein